MRFLNYLIFSFFLLSNARAQQNHFMYVETENKQAFYIKLDEKIFSSTGSGYVIIPKLITGSYKFNIGFPKNEWPVQHINVTINDNDEGFLLKNFGDKGWGLFNIQTMEVLMGSSGNSVKVPVVQNKTDAFSNTLAEVTNTPSIKQEDTATKITGTISTDTIKSMIKEEVSKESMVVSQKENTVSQVLSILDTSGRSAVYAINDGDNNDTIRIFIPYNKKDIDAIKKNVEGSEVMADSIIKKDSVNIVSQPFKDTMPKPVEVNSGNKNQYTVTVVNPDCKSSATDDDFSKLRKKMVAVNDDDEKMMEIARRSFKSKCFSSSQVKDLSQLFVSDEGKYNFFDAAYSHVSDIGNFKELQSQLSSEYYITRFKAMLR